MTTGSRAQHIAEQVIRHACRRLPDDIRDERCREWAAEVPAILRDPHIRFGWLRSVRALLYAAGSYRSARHLSRAAGVSRSDLRQAQHAGGVADGWASRSRRHPLARPRLPNGVVPAAAAVFLWLLLIVVIRAYPPSGSWSYLYAAVGVGCEILATVAIVRFIRWIRRHSRHSGL